MRVARRRNSFRWIPLCGALQVTSSISMLAFLPALPGFTRKRTSACLVKRMFRSVSTCCLARDRRAQSTTPDAGRLKTNRHGCERTTSFVVGTRTARSKCSGQGQWEKLGMTSVVRKCWCQMKLLFQRMSPVMARFGCPIRSVTVTEVQETPNMPRIGRQRLLHCCGVCAISRFRGGRCGRFVLSWRWPSRLRSGYAVPLFD